MLPVATREHISTVLGYSSIVAWIFAQAPQLVKNWQLGSAEGLALPFLVSWFFGDLTNLIGCILTRQLPFQTYLATYFVFVDVGLLSQYIYYSRIHPIPVIPPLAHSGRQSNLRQSRSENWSAHRNRSRKRRSKSGGGENERSRRSLADGDLSASEDPMAQSWMSESSATHSPASALASSSHRSRPVSNTASSIAPGSTEPPSPVIPHPERGRTLTRPQSTSRPSFFGSGLETISGSPASGSPAGVRVQEDLGHVQPPEEEWVGSRRNTSSTSRSRPPATRRATSMMFLSVGLLVTFGSWGGNKDIMSGGRAWSTDLKQNTSSSRPWWESARHPVLHISSHSPNDPFPSLPSNSHHRRNRVFPITVSVPIGPSRTPNSPAEETNPPEHDHDHDDDYPYPKRDLERFIGRASAWVCTTLYLTSRLPQIWQNFRRQSVEGLSMLLFVMAFVGNSLYVLSILTHPSLSQPGYLLESTPYLMGSGGTLCFDITIVFQSFLYSDKRKARLERDRRRSGKYSTVDVEEAAALLHDQDDEDDTDPLRTPGKRRSRSRSAGDPTGRSRSSRRTISRHRSDSTQLATKYSADSGLLDDTSFDFGTYPTESSPIVPRSLSRGARTRSNTLEEPQISPIPEAVDEGQSSVTIRP